MLPLLVLRRDYRRLRTMRTSGGVTVCSSGICVAGLLLALLSAAVSQDLPFNANVKIARNTIDYIPPVASAVLTGDREQVIKALGASDNVNAIVRAKDGARAGFTPLILAATLSNPEIAQILIKNGAKITVLDDFHRSAFWYAALRNSPSTAEVLVTAPDVGDVINAADEDLKRTPLHLAVRGASPRLVTLLLKAGASASKEQKDIMGETPVDFCKRHSTSACKGL
jgi:ankyrin repeat protein